jgi:hypothetical protein
VKAKLIILASDQVLFYLSEPLNGPGHLAFTSKSKGKAQIVLVMPGFRVKKPSVELLELII